MIYAILSDIHANFEALQEVLADAESQGAARIICLGDTVGYGPRPRETLNLIRERATIVLAGNHDDAVSRRLDPEDFIDVAKEAVKRHRASLSSADLKYLAELPYLGDLNEDILFAHGDVVYPEAFNYIGSAEAAEENMRAEDFKLLFVGHTHIPVVHIADKVGKVTSFEPHDFTADVNHRYIVNVGSVGYPRQSQGQCESTYVLFDSTTRSVRFRHLPFAVSSLLQRGDNKRKHVGRLLGALATALTLAVVGFGTHTLLSDSEREIAVEAINTDTPILSTEEVFFTPSKTKVRANLQLAKASKSVHLSIDFLDEHQKTIKSHRLYVSSSSRKAFAIPEGAIKAKFCLRAAEAQTEIVVKRFSPSAE